MGSTVGAIVAGPPLLPSSSARQAGTLTLVAALFAGFLLGACGSKSPTTPTQDPPAPTPQTRFTLTGRVVAGTGGAALASARVEVSTGVNAGKNTTTNAEGRYTLSDLESGEMTLQVSATGYTTQTSKITLGANQTVDFTLPTAPPQEDRVSLSGVVSFPATAPCLGATVVEVTSGPDAGQKTSADDAGRYTLTNLHKGALTIRASAPGHLPKTADLTLTADQTADFMLASSPYLTTGRAVDAVTQSGVAGIKVDGDGVSGTSCDASGAFLVTAATGSSEPRLLIFTGPDLVERRTNARVPGADLVISLIANGFDLRAFDEMFRSPLLHRWTSAPPVNIETRTLQFTEINQTDAVAMSEIMSSADAASIITDFTWALPQLTGGTFNDFASVSKQESAQGTRVSLLNDGTITVARMAGLTTATGFWGYGRWRFRTDGSVIAGIVMLDRDFDKSGSTFTRSLRSHELGHALGYQHVTARASVMNADARTQPNDFDRDAARIAFQRLPGNRSPDVDPTSASINRYGSAVWSPPIR
jgi:predicted Zn-dependent protease